MTTWKNLGYTSALLLQGWDGITSAFKTNFPGKTFSVAIIDSTNPFPDFGAASSRSGKSLSTGQYQPLLQVAAQKFPGHLVIQNNSLYENEPAQAETVDFATSLSTMIAFQTNLVLGVQGGASCARRPQNGAACKTSQDYLALLNTGIHPAPNLRAQYIEVFAANAIKFRDAILTAHNELLPQPPSRNPPNPCPRGVRYCN